MTKKSKEKFIIKTTCPARSGIVAAVSNYLYSKDCYISEMHQFDDIVTGELFMRTECYVESDQYTSRDVAEGFEKIANEFNMAWEQHDSSPAKVIIMVSKFDHCLENLLYRVRKGELDMEIVSIVSNHMELRHIAEREYIRFDYLPVNPENKKQQEQALKNIIDETGAELTILARYMQILSNEFCEQMAGKIINIHHSFLPGFKGAKPYHQAYERGVKLIGATAHYITADLDEGPIIAQDVQTVDHTYTPKMLTATGRDTETKALAQAVNLHINHRVFLNGNKTVIF